MKSTFFLVLLQNNYTTLIDKNLSDNDGGGETTLHQCHLPHPSRLQATSGRPFSTEIAGAAS